MQSRMHIVLVSGFCLGLGEGESLEFNFEWVWKGSAKANALLPKESPVWGKTRVRRRKPRVPVRTGLKRGYQNKVRNNKLFFFPKKHFIVERSRSTDQPWVNILIKAMVMIMSRVWVVRKRKPRTAVGFGLETATEGNCWLQKHSPQRILKNSLSVRIQVFLLWGWVWCWR